MVNVYQQKGLDLYPSIDSTIREILKQKTILSGYFEIDRHLYNPLRQQYNAMSIIDQMVESGERNSNQMFLLVDIDIYVQGVNYVFGLADPVRRTALVSTYRLAGENFDARLAKETVHELGHVFGFQHCPVPECVMFFSHTVTDTDHKLSDFCPNCRSRL